MQSQSVILLAEVLHNELQTEAARLQIVNQACADRPTAIEVVARAGRRFWIAIANIASLHVPGASTRGRGNSSPEISELGANAV